MYKQVGKNYKDTILIPIVEGTVKNVIGGWNASDLIANRAKATSDILAKLQEQLDDNYINVTDFNITDIDYSDVFEKAIEGKVTAEQEALINFYDNIFSTIAEKGWTHNNQVNNPEYLNQMLQNNLYTITVTDRSPVEIKEEGFCGHCGEEVEIVKSCKLENSYSTDIASNFSQIFFMNDTNLRDQALVEYEYQKSIINQKESRIDTRMQDLKTEQSAINQMLQGLETVKKENIERTMNIFA
jgi:hypothetical protein